MLKKSEKTSDAFWQEFEETHCEKVLARGLGKYVSGWEEFDSSKCGGIWGLVINTSGGFRFHHFPQESWMDALTRFAAKDSPKEKTIFIPNEKIISQEIIKEPKWWKRIFSSSPPRLVIRYYGEAEREARLIFEAEYNASNQP
jgi:hypothetical protein